MCTGLEPALIAGLVSAAGTGVSAVAQQQALKKQDREAAEGIRRTSDIQRQAGSKVNENIKQLQASDPNVEKQAATGDFLAALKQRQAAGTGGGLDAVGGASGRYAEDVNAARGQVENDTSGLVKQLAAIDAPGYQRMREGQSAANVTSQLGLLDRDAQARDFLTRMKVGSITANPWAQALGSGMQGYASGMASSAGRVKPGAKIKPGTVWDTAPMRPVGIGDGLPVGNA